MKPGRSIPERLAAELVVVAAGKIIDPGRASLEGPVLGRQGGTPGQFLGRVAWVAVEHLDPEAEPFAGIDLTESMQGAPARAVDHLFRAAGLRAEKAGLGQGAVPAHAAVKEKGLEQVFTKGEKTAGQAVARRPEADEAGRPEKEAPRLECAVVDLPVDGKEG